MKYYLLFATFIVCLYGKSSAAVSFNLSATVILPEKERLASLSPELPLSLSKMKVKDFEKMTGRKLSLKEKIGFYILKSKLNKQTKKEAGTDNGKTAFLLGLLSLCCLIIPFVSIASLPLAIVAIITGNKALKKNPSDRKAKTGVILGWVTIGLFVLIVALVIALISSFYFV